MAASSGRGCSPFSVGGEDVTLEGLQGPSADPAACADRLGPTALTWRLYRGPAAVVFTSEIRESHDAGRVRQRTVSALARAGGFARLA